MSFAPKIAATALAVLVLASCGKASNGTSKASSSDTASSSSSASSAPSASSTDTAAPATGRAMTGTGYAYHLPSKWQDITKQLKKTQPGIDTGGRQNPATPPFTANLNTLTTPSQIKGTATDSDLTALAAQIKKEVATLAPKVQTKPNTAIDGAPAVHQEGAATSGKTKFFLVQYFAIYKGHNFGLTFAFPSKSTASQRNKVVDPVLSSWKWS